VALRRPLPILLIGLLLGGTLSSCTGDDESGRFRLGKVTRSDVAELVEAPGTVAARATATLRAPAEGTVRRLQVHDGERVRAGDVLARIDSPSARERLRQARDADAGLAGGAVVPAGVNLDGVQRQIDRTAERGFRGAREVAGQIPDPRQRARVLTEITRAEAQYRTASAAARNAVAQLNAGLGSIGAAMSSITSAQRVQTRAAVRAAEQTVRALTLKAPFDGIAGLGGPSGGPGGLGDLAAQLPQQLQGQPGALPELPTGGGSREAASVAEGAPVSGGDAIVTVTDVSELMLRADVDETDILQVKRGVAADVELDAVQGARYTAEVTGVGVTPKESTGGGVTYQVTLALRRGTTSDGAEAPWPKPGMSAVLSLRVREVRATLAVPSSAVVTSGRDTTVWVVAGGRAQRRVVRLGAQGDTVVEVTSGLREGEQIVVRGAASVRQGQDVAA
jgi:HlyD family secretion protein